MKNKIVEISIYIAIIICFGINFYLGLLAIFSLAIFDNLKNPPDITPSPNKQIYQNLWKMFFKTIAIEERENARCQMQFMPKKYWQDLIEEP